jgi:plasmid stabilization system protein ParE
MNARQMNRECTLDAVRSAVKLLADGPRCFASKKRIAQTAGLRSPETAKRYIRLLESEGTLSRLYDWRDGVSCSFYVLLDHPEAREVIDELSPRDVDRRTRLRIFCG